MIRPDVGMTPVAAARRYAEHGFPVFPCIPDGVHRKCPLTKAGFHDATTDPSQIEEWWRRWPRALVGTPTGHRSVVLDIDVKRPEANGFDTLAELGFATLPDAPMAHTASGGLHIHFETPEPAIRNTAGKRGCGIGPGLDWRGVGGYVILPSPGSGYRWDPAKNFRTTPSVPVPDALRPREPERPATSRPVPPSNGLSRYAEAALDGACRAIVSACAGEQEITLHRECFSIGTLAAAGAIPESFAFQVLLFAARSMPSYDHRRPWHPAEVARKVDRSFTAGLAHPRGAAG
jgi:hypothetical protein